MPFSFGPSGCHMGGQSGDKTRLLKASSSKELALKVKRDRSQDQSVKDIHAGCHFAERLGSKSLGGERESKCGRNWASVHLWENVGASMDAIVGECLPVSRISN